jgi:hypothetical protein
MAILFAMAVALLSQEAQATVVPPSLHQRAILAAPIDPSPISPAEDSRIVATWKRGATDFPAEAAGFYRFHDDAQGVRIVSHDGEISGYLLKLGKGIIDKDMVLGYDFSEVAGTRNQLYFTTRQVHGIWYGFEGKVVEHRGLNHEDLTNYILQGTLTEHDESQQTTQSAAIRLRYEGPH